MIKSKINSKTSIILQISDVLKERLDGVFITVPDGEPPLLIICNQRSRDNISNGFVIFNFKTNDFYVQSYKGSDIGPFWARRVTQLNDDEFSILVEVSKQVC